MDSIGKTALAIFLVAALCTRGSGQETIRIASEEWPPYSGSELKHYGVMNRIIAEAFESENVKAEFGFFPGPRTLHLVKSGEWAATGGWTPTAERAKHHYFSHTLLDETLVFFHLKANRFNWKTMDDLAGIGIGTVYGSYYGPAFDKAEKAGQLAIQKETSDSLNFKKLLHGRIAICPKNLDAGLALLRQEFTPEERELITYHRLPVDQGPLVMMFSRKVATNRDMVERFNRGLARLKKDGRYDQFLMESRRGDYATRGNKAHSAPSN